MNTRTTLLTLTASLALAACAGTDDTSGGADPVGWEPLMTAEWTAEAGAETNVCARTTVGEDVTFGAIHVVSPSQARHILVTAGTPDGPDGITECEPFEGHEHLLYAAGPMGEPFVLPAKVAMEVPAGSQLLLNVAVANQEPSTQPASLNVYVQPVDRRAITDLAEAVLMSHDEGDDLTVCTMAHDSFPFAVALQTAPSSHVTMVAKSSFAGEVTLFDAPAADQQVHLLDGPVGMRAGEPIELSCSAMEVVGGRVGVAPGASGDCLAAVYRYPARPDTSWWCDR